MTLPMRAVRAVDLAVAFSLAAAYVVALLLSVDGLGYARDEGFYFHAAQAYERWFRLLFEDPGRAMQLATVDRYWAVNHEHPALMKSLFALSHTWLHERWGWFAEAGTAYRFPGMLMGGLAVATIYLWGSQLVGSAAGWVGALLFAFMPRVFYHSHLDCFDVPVASMWLVTVYAYARSLQARGLGWPLATGILYGLLLNTKHNAWLLPGALIAHLLITRGGQTWRALKQARLPIPPALVAMATLGPAVLFLTWPWLWHDTFARLTEWARFHLAHDYYNMEFLGRTYHEPPMPRLYAWVMTVATVPAATLVLFVIGLAQCLRCSFGGSIERCLMAIRAGGLARAMLPAAGARWAMRAAEPASSQLLWLVSLLVSYAPWWSDQTPIFGGTKHWLPAYPFLCLFAGAGFALTCARIRQLLPSRRYGPAMTGALAVCVVTGPAVMTWTSHPWGLTAYTPLVGGAPGAAALGLNRSFWGYTTGAVLNFINERAPRGARVYLHDTALQSWHMLQRDGRVRADLRGTLDIAASNVAIYHHEQHMARVEHQIWVDYGTTTPAFVAGLHGVPVVWVYERPAAQPK